MSQQYFFFLFFAKACFTHFDLPVLIASFCDTELQLSFHFCGGLSGGRLEAGVPVPSPVCYLPSGI